ncbi:MAG: hypothetical protein ACOC98_03720 [Thermodesulfobacteriota bacterium]
MEKKNSDYRDELFQEIQATPVEYLPNLLNIVRSFRESVSPKSAEDSFQQAWKEAMTGETISIEELWEDIPDGG